MKHVTTASKPRSGLSRQAWLLPVAIAVVAFVVRWESVQHSGGLHALLGYDEGVYFGASTSFVSGLMPYRDFVLVHPPGSVVLLSPFALLGKLTTDSTGWVTARIFVMLLGAFNAAVVFVIARRISLVAAVVAGGLYAVRAPVVHVERTTMLEAFVLMAIVVALWALRTPQESTWRLALAGAFLGLGAATKLWGLVPWPSSSPGC
jgi:alpha-1,2-mannosyltransferase